MWGRVEGGIHERRSRERRGKGLRGKRLEEEERREKLEEEERRKKLEEEEGWKRKKAGGGRRKGPDGERSIERSPERKGEGRKFTSM